MTLAVPIGLPRLTPNQAWAHQRSYQAGVNLGGWLVLEPWMFDLPPYASAGAELDVISKLRTTTNDTHTIATIRNHWGGFVDDATLRVLADFGITSVRIPVGCALPSLDSSSSVEKILPKRARFPPTSGAFASRLDPRLTRARCECDHCGSARHVRLWISGGRVRDRRDELS